MGSRTFTAGIQRETGSDSVLKRDECASPYWKRLSHFVVVASFGAPIENRPFGKKIASSADLPNAQ